MLWISHQNIRNTRHKPLFYTKPQSEQEHLLSEIIPNSGISTWNNLKA